MGVTKKLYNEKPFLKNCHAKVIEIDLEKGIVLDQTVSFPEGGGQEGDRGILKLLGSNEIIQFHDTQKGLGENLLIQDFPTIQIKTPIYHKIEENDLDKFQIGMEVEVQVDIQRRMNLSASHTATHLLLMGVESIYEGFEKRVYGCHIKENGGRLDFRTNEKFDAEIVKKIEEYANDLITQNHEVSTFAHENEPEAIYWKCKETIYPCGGTHLTQTKNIQTIKVRRKNLGKNGQRLSFEMDQIIPFEEQYYENN